MHIGIAIAVIVQVFVVFHPVLAFVVPVLRGHRSTDHPYCERRSAGETQDVPHGDGSTICTGKRHTTCGRRKGSGKRWRVRGLSGGPQRSRARACCASTK